MLTVVSFVFVLGMLVFVHELGHFVTAKRLGVTVQEFGFGFPPRIFAVTVGETKYSLNLLPIGGFVKMLGEEDPTDKGSLASKSIWARMLVLSAGSVMNGLFAVALFSLSFAIPKDTVAGNVVVSGVSPNSPAEAAGITPGDSVVSVNGRRIQNSGDLVYNVQLNLGSETEVTLVKPDGRIEPVRLVPRWNPPTDQGAIGIQFQMPEYVSISEAYPIWESIPLGLQKSFDMLTIAKNDLISMAVRRIAPPVVGAIGIAQMTGEVAKMGFGYLAEFAGLLSINLAVVNMLPIPMLDGGRVLFVVIEGIRGGKRIPPEKESFVHFVGLVVLLALMVVIGYQDIVRIMNGESLFR